MLKIKNKQVKGEIEGIGPRCFTDLGQTALIFFSFILLEICVYVPDKAGISWKHIWVSVPHCQNK